MTPRRRVLVISNPAAGRRRPARLRATLDALPALGASVTYRETETRGHAAVLARDEAAGGAFDVVVAAGGDGTINEVVNGLAGAPVALGLLPLATANVLAREIGLGHDPATLARVIVHGPLAELRPGIVNGRRFVVMASCGLDARVVERVSVDLKRRVGSGAYAVETVRQSFTRAALLQVTIAGRAHAAHWVIASRGTLYGLGFVCAPAARIDAPTLEIVLARGAGPARNLLLALALLRGHLATARGVTVLPARELSIDAPGAEPVQADGDIVARVPARIVVAEQPMQLAVPDRGATSGRLQSSSNAQWEGSR